MTQPEKYPLVSLQRDEFDDMPWFGFVVGMSDTLVALHLISDTYSLDGYIVLRQGDITRHDKVFEKRALVIDALRLKGQAASDPGPLDLSGVRGLMESVQGLYPVLVINREQMFPGECDIGTVRMASKESYGLRCLSGTAQWENDDRTFQFKDVTMVQFGGEYEQTLALVAQSRGNDV